MLRKKVFILTLEHEYNKYFTFSSNLKQALNIYKLISKVF